MNLYFLLYYLVFNLRFLIRIQKHSKDRINCKKKIVIKTFNKISFIYNYLFITSIYKFSNQYCFLQLINIKESREKYKNIYHCFIFIAFHSFQDPAPPPPQKKLLEQSIIITYFSDSKNYIYYKMYYFKNKMCIQHMIMYLNECVAD